MPEQDHKGLQNKPQSNMIGMFSVSTSYMLGQIQAVSGAGYKIIDIVNASSVNPD